jgi:predicted XRE-type DNA-binding protein
VSELELFLDALEDLPTDQLDQLSRLLDAVRTYLPDRNLNDAQVAQRSRIIRRSVAKVRAGITDAELEALLRGLRALNLESLR